MPHSGNEVKAGQRKRIHEYPLSFKYYFKEDCMKDFKFSTIEYSRPDFDQYEAEFQAMTKQIKEAKDYSEIQKIIKHIDEVTAPVQTMCTVAMIRNTLNTTDEFYEKEVEFINERNAEANASYITFCKALVNSTFIEDINKEYGKELLISIQREIDQFKEELIPFIQKEAKLTQQYQKIMATASIPFKGETLNLYGIKKYFEDPDREIRRDAFKAYSDFYHSKEEEMEQIFDELVAIRNEMGQALGYDNYIPLAYMQQQRSDYGVKEVAAFREQVLREIVPLCETLYDIQKKRIGVSDFKVYDEEFLFTDGNATPIGDDDYLIEEARKMYHDLSPETGEFIDFMIKH